ncbi:YxcD family protein [Paenibacillus cisolokensis]|jgi:hypothetical protein|uniref:DUF2653 domain-containing protein n=1 Tax=Paenibacillus cisolokensis TaxID=1658519 RepID=A0ABQ4N413_9BACL|nr:MULTISPECIES: YxcD family protein [Paenibacillus]ALS27901.1 hypothetical protein IJ21_25050 [Paenibacillus sp. 32O-W]GIQ62900.1 hypothetical protein PACILC2_14680 [Paenibacillus cisolokensis]
MRIYTDEIINAVCHHMASRKGVPVSKVEAQLSWDEDYGFTAEVWVDGRSQYLVEANLLEAIEQYMYNHYNIRVFRSQITLDADEEFWADIEV